MLKKVNKEEDEDEDENEDVVGLSGSSDVSSHARDAGSAGVTGSWSGTPMWQIAGELEEASLLAARCH